MDLIKDVNTIVWLVGIAASAVWIVAEIKGVSRSLIRDIKHLTEAINDLKEQQHEYVRDYSQNKETTAAAIGNIKERLSLIEAKCLHYHGGINK